MRRIFWMAVVSIIALGSLTTSATLSLFSTHNHHPDHTYTSADLCLQSVRAGADTQVPGPMFYVPTAQPAVDLQPTGVWAPGDTISRFLRVTNTCGTRGNGDRERDSKLAVAAGSAPDDGDHSPSVDAWLDRVKASLETGDAQLADKLTVSIYTASTTAPRVKVGSAQLSQLLTGSVPLRYPGRVPLRIPLSAAAARSLEFEVLFDRSAGNADQTKSIMVTFKVTAIHTPPQRGRLSCEGEIFDAF